MAQAFFKITPISNKTSVFPKVWDVCHHVFQLLALQLLEQKKDKGAIIVIHINITYIIIIISSYSPYVLNLETAYEYTLAKWQFA